MKNRTRIFVIFLLGLLMGTSQAQAQTTRPNRRPATRPVTQPASRPAAEITPEAKIILDRVDAVYAKSQPIKLVAQITGDFDVAGRQKKYTLEITARTDGAGRFIHRADQVGVVEQTARELYLYDQKRNTYGYLKYPATRPIAEKLQEEVFDILIDENPSLLLSLVTDPAKALARDAKKLSAEGPILVIAGENDVRKVEFDENGYITKVVIDFSPEFKARNTQNFKSAVVQITYLRTDRVLSMDENAFDFKPPDNASQSDLIREKTGHTTSPTTQISTSNN